MKTQLFAFLSFAVLLSAVYGEDTSDVSARAELATRSGFVELFGGGGYLRHFLMNCERKRHEKGD